MFEQYSKITSWSELTGKQLPVEAKLKTLIAYLAFKIDGRHVSRVAPKCNTKNVVFGCINPCCKWEVRLYRGDKSFPYIVMPPISPHCMECSAPKSYDRKPRSVSQLELTRRFGHRKVTRKEVEEAGIRIPYSTLALLNQTAPDVSEHRVDDLTVQTTASTESAKKSNGDAEQCPRTITLRIGDPVGSLSSLVRLLSNAPYSPQFATSTIQRLKNEPRDVNLDGVQKDDILGILVAFAFKSLFKLNLRPERLRVWLRADSQKEPDLLMHTTGVFLEFDQNTQVLSSNVFKVLENMFDSDFAVATTVNLRDALLPLEPDVEICLDGVQDWDVVGILAEAFGRWVMMRDFILPTLSENAPPIEAAVNDANQAEALSLTF